jgi:NTE family protein
MVEIKDFGIKYLAFEGGGGWGSAYLGALKALESLKIIQYKKYDNGSGTTVKYLDPAKIKGISGTSVGAITASLVAAGYDHKFFYRILSSQLALSFYDEPKPFKCPGLILKESKFESIKIFKNIRKKSLKLNDYAFTTIASESSRVFWQLIKPFFYLDSLKNLTPFFIKKSLNQPVPYMFKKVIQNPDPYFLSFIVDMGLFTGENVRNFVERSLKSHTGIENITFKQFYELTSREGDGIHLKIAGVCLNTGEVVWFDHLGPWKNLPISDAVRISMSIPGVFKPVAIPKTKSSEKIDLEKSLLFIDGGVLNNTPLHAFDEYSENEKPYTKIDAFLFGGKAKPLSRIASLNKNILGLRLTHPSEKQFRWFDNGLSMLGGTVNILISQSENSQIRTRGEAEQTIDLDTSGLSIFDFKVDKQILREKCVKIHNYTKKWLQMEWKIPEVN